MNPPLQVSGYDNQTELLAVSHIVPTDLAAMARRLAHVDPKDDGEGAYPLEVADAIALGLKMHTPLNPDLYDWVLEPALTD